HFSFAGGGATTRTGSAHSIGRDARSTDATAVDGKFRSCVGRRLVRRVGRVVEPEGFASFGTDGPAADREFLNRLDGAAVCRRSHIYRCGRVWTRAGVAAFPIGPARRARIKRPRVDGRRFAVAATHMAGVGADRACTGFARERWPALTKLCAFEQRATRIRSLWRADDPIFVAANRVSRRRRDRAVL